MYTCVSKSLLGGLGELSKLECLELYPICFPCEINSIQESGSGGTCDILHNTYTQIFGCFLLCVCFCFGSTMTYLSRLLFQRWQLLSLLRHVAYEERKPELLMQQRNKNSTVTYNGSRHFECCSSWQQMLFLACQIVSSLS